MISELLNTLYVQAQGAYLRLDHETVRVEVEAKEALQVPLHHLGGIATFGNVLLSPFLIQRCGEDQRAISWFSRSGRFAGRLQGPTSGNVLLRLAQHSAFRDPTVRLGLARHILAGKVRNARVTIHRAYREGALIPDRDRLVAILDNVLAEVPNAGNLDHLLGLEGTAAGAYFEALPGMIRSEGFVFDGRNRRPPRDPVNALLSFAYTLLAGECASALEGVGLDPQLGFFHAPRPGRSSLALDLMEEFRPILADRAVLALINRRQLKPEDFVVTDGGAVQMRDEARRTFLQNWQTRKQETVEHAVVGKPVPVGLLPHVQARLLARHLRGDIPEYPPYQAR